MPDYVPVPDAQKVTWLTNLKDNIASHATALEITAARVTQITAWCDDLIALIQSVTQKKNEWLAEAALKKSQDTTSVGGLRGEVAQWKANPGMTPAIAADLQIVGTGSGFDPDTFKPDVKAEVFSGYVRLKFKKGQTDGVNFYWRKQGESGWKFLARDTNSPYDDHTPLTTAGVPEVREYQAFGVLNDAQIGQPSDIVSVAFGG